MAESSPVLIQNIVANVRVSLSKREQLIGAGRQVWHAHFIRSSAGKILK